MRLALEQFRRCTALCRQHSFGRAEVGSMHMIGVTRRYLNEFCEAIDDLRAATNMAAEVGNRRAEMVALTILGELLVDHGNFEDAYAALDKAIAIADALRNRRFRIYGLYELGRAIWYDDRRQDEAEPALAEALKLSRETGMNFLGPRVLAAKAIVCGSASGRREALDEGEAIIRSGCLAHVALWFYRDAIEASLNAADWLQPRGMPRRWRTTPAQSRCLGRISLARGRALARSAAGRRHGATLQELCRLRDEADRLGLGAALQHSVPHRSRHQG
jgi:tetratricopeptide (TPR) repeat protein